MKQIYIQSYFRSGYNRFMNYINNITNHPKRKEIEERLKIIKFFDEFGAKATDKAFSKKRSTIYLWKQKIKNAGGKLSALAPESTAPKTRKKRKLTDEMISFITNYRISHPGADQTSIKPALDVFCLEHNLPTVCEGTIANTIRELKDKGSQYPTITLKLLSMVKQVSLNTVGLVKEKEKSLESAIMFLKIRVI